MELSDEGATLVLMMHDTGGEELYVLVSIYDIVCCVLALMLEQGLFRNQALTNEKNFLTQLVHMQEEQYRTSKANVEMVNIKCHDMKHQISHITSTTDPDAIRELEQIISVYDSSLQTGNEILDVCLMEKKLLCEKNSIKLDCIANGQCLSFMQPSDLFSLFGNALDNAMEAVCKLDDVEKRIIFVSVKENSAWRLFMWRTTTQANSSWRMAFRAHPRTTSFTTATVSRAFVWWWKSTTATWRSCRKMGFLI